MQRSGQDLGELGRAANPEVQIKAEKYVGTGYQRLLTFEVPGGGFSLFGDPPADVFLSAFGLMEFNDMAQVYPVDQAVIQRTAQWLFSQQQADGSWNSPGYSEHWQIGAQVPATAYITWALVEAGYGQTPQAKRAINYLRDSAAHVDDAYALALVANALAAYAPDDATTQAVVKRLYEMRTPGEDNVYWTTSGASFMGASGQSGSLETTALAAIALMRAKTHPDAVSGALAYLVQSKDSWGTWSTTQATILSLKALLLASEKTGQATEPATIHVRLNQEQTQEIVIDQSNSDVTHLVTFEHGFAPDGANRLQIELQGGGNLMYQVATSYYLPWDQVQVHRPSVSMGEPEELISIDLAYDRRELAVNDTVRVEVEARLNHEGTVQMALLDLGVPPGFSVLAEDLSVLVEQRVISRYELTGRQIIIYVENLASQSPLRFDYRLQARFPMRAQTPPSSAYDYYNPGQLTVQEPLEMVVNE